MERNYFYRDSTSIKQYILLPILLHAGSVIVFIVVTTLLTLNGASVAAASWQTAAALVPIMVGLFFSLHKYDFRQLKRGTWPMHSVEDEVAWLKTALQRSSQSKRTVATIRKDAEKMLLDAHQILRDAQSLQRNEIALSVKPHIQKVKQLRIEAREVEKGCIETHEDIRKRIKNLELKRRVEEYDSHQWGRIVELQRGVDIVSAKFLERQTVQSQISSKF